MLKLMIHVHLGRVVLSESGTTGILNVFVVNRMKYWIMMIGVLGH